MPSLYDEITAYAAGRDTTGLPGAHPHPDDTRAALAAIGERRAAGERVRAEAMQDLSVWAPAAVEAGIGKKEIAGLAGVTRQTVYAILDGG